MSEYRFSIIIPHYNDTESLKALIDTVPDRKDIQVIIIDDNTYPEQTTMQHIVDELKRENITLAFNEIGKRGAGGCRNIGLQLAKGKWIICADADDLFVERAFQIFDNNYDLNAEIIYFNMYSINMPEKELGSRHLQYERLVKNYLKHPNRTNELNLRYNFPSPCSKMVLRDMVEKNNIHFDDLLWSNDDMFATKCGYYAKKIAAADERVYFVTRKNGTITTSKSIEAFKTRVDVYIKKMVFLRNSLSQKDFKKVARWPGNKLVVARLDGYGKEMERYIMKCYRDNGISLWWINRSDISEVFLKIKSYLSDIHY